MTPLNRLKLVNIWLLLNLFVLLRPVSSSVAAETIVPGEPELFKETGHTLAYSFRQAWEQNGGLPIIGYPLTEVFVEDGRPVQYFERARLEWHADLITVQTGLLGSWVAANRRSEPAFLPVAPPLATRPGKYFSETHHNLQNGFLEFWSGNGGLTVFGFPISEEFSERNQQDGVTYSVQYFERSRFEYHADRPSGAQVLLGHLGRQYLEQKRNAPAWAVARVESVEVAWQALQPSHIKFPRVGLDTDIVEGGFSFEGWDVPRYTAVHYWPVAAYPGTKGNIILAGHAGYKNTIFDQLPQAVVGDTVIVAVDKAERSYMVNSIQIVEPEDTWVLNPTAGEVLTLITCVPPGQFTHRLIVRAVPVDNPPAAKP